MLMAEATANSFVYPQENITKRESVIARENWYTIKTILVGHLTLDDAFGGAPVVYLAGGSSSIEKKNLVYFYVQVTTSYHNTLLNDGPKLSRTFEWIMFQFSCVSKNTKGAMAKVTPEHFTY